MTRNFRSSLMVNPFRKSLVTGISELNRLGLAALMHRCGQRGRFAMLSAELKASIDAVYMIIGWLHERLVGKVDGELKQLIVFTLQGTVKGGHLRRIQIHFIGPCHSG